MWTVKVPSQYAVDCEGSSLLKRMNEEEKPDGDISDKTVDEDVTENSLNFWDMLPDEIIEKIIFDGIKCSADKCQTYTSILHTCSRFQRFQEKGKLLLPQIYIKPDDYIQQCSSLQWKV